MCLARWTRAKELGLLVLRRTGRCVRADCPGLPRLSVGTYFAESTSARVTQMLPKRLQISQRPRRGHRLGPREGLFPLRTGGRGVEFTFGISNGNYSSSRASDVYWVFTGASPGSTKPRRDILRGLCLPLFWW